MDRTVPRGAAILAEMRHWAEYVVRSSSQP